MPPQKAIVFRPVTRGCAGGAKPPLETFLAPLEKCVGHSLKIFDIVQKFWAPLGNLFAPPGVPSWLRVWLFSELVTCDRKIANVFYFFKNTKIKVPEKPPFALVSSLKLWTRQKQILQFTVTCPNTFKYKFIFILNRYIHSNRMFWIRCKDWLTMRSVTWNRFPNNNLRLIPYFFHLWSEVTWTLTALTRYILQNECPLHKNRDCVQMT